MGSIDLVRFSRATWLPKWGLMFVLMPTLVLAQQSDEGLSDEEQTADEGRAMEEIVVTGAPGGSGLTKFEASYAITTFNEAELERIAPASTADLLGHVPGFFTEGGTAGEASNNAHVRGIPSGTGGFKFLPLLVDGLPMFEEPDIDFMNNDVFIRADLMTKTVEGVKGGPSAIFYSHAIGGAANFITRTGTQDPEGAIKFEYGDWNHLRSDFYTAGPINDNLTYAVGGFYRASDGVRDPGYNANDGGQLRGNIVYENDEQDMRIEMHAHVLNDQTIFYQNLPFSIPVVTTDGTEANPTEIDGAREVGLDFGTDTWASPNLRRGTIVTQEGLRDYDLAEGIHPDFTNFTLRFRKDFNSWTIENNMRKLQGSSGFNAIFAATPASNAQFLNDRENNDIANPAFSAAQTCDLNNVFLAYFAVDASNCGDNLGVADRDEFIGRYANYSSIAAIYPDDGTPVNPNADLSIPTIWLANVDASMFVNELKLHKEVEFIGYHSLTAGAYFSRYDMDQDWSISQIVTDVGPDSRPVDIVALTGTGSRVGPRLTDNGILKHGILRQIAGGEFQTYAIYLHDDWQFNDRWNFNLGVRFQELALDTSFFASNAGQDLTPDDIVPGSTNDTIADNDVIGRSGRVITNSESFNETGYTAAFNFEWTEDLAIFGRVGDSFRLPSPKNFWDNRAVTDPIERVMLAEGGIKYRRDTYDIFATVYWNEFTATGRNYEYTDITDPNCQPPPGVLQDLDDCRIARGIERRGTENIGIEVEFSWQPEGFAGFSLDTALTYQQPEFSGGDVPAVQEVTQNNPTTGFPEVVGYEIVQLGIDGNIPRRFAETMIDVRPAYDLTDTFNIPVTVYASVQHFSERFAENDNFVVYPAYTNMNLGATYQLNDNVRVQLHVNNVTDENTVTEGDNPRSGNPRSPDGTRTYGIARPLIGRSAKLSLTYEF